MTDRKALLAHTMPAPLPTPTITRFDRVLGFFAPRAALSRVRARHALDLAAQYRGAESTRLRSGWLFGEGEPDADRWELTRLRERSRDLNRNDAVSHGATETIGINVVGQGLRPQSRIRPDLVPIQDEAELYQLQRQAEQIWNRWSVMADAGNRMDFDEMQFLALRKVIEDGEVLVLPVMADEKWRPIRRALELIEAHRLTPKKWAPDNTTGIKLGSRGEPISYTIKTGSTFSTIKARDRSGRPRILHLYRASRPGQLRGVPWFAPVLNLFKDLSEYLEAEVIAARVAACLAIFVSKENPWAAAEANTAETETAGSRLQEIQPGMIEYLKPGEAITAVDPKRPADSFAPFVESLLRMIGISLGLPYELLVKDFSRTNYSSARAALLEGRRHFMAWRSWFARRFCQPIYELVLEEAYLRGLWDPPAFYEYRSEYCRALWIGGAWGWVDPTKEVEASQKAIDYGLSTLADEAAAQGRDWEEIQEQRARERQKISELQGGRIDADTEAGTE